MTDSDPNIPPKRYRILSLLTLVLSSTLAAAVQPKAVSQNQKFVLGLVPLHFGLLGSVICCLDGSKNSRGRFKLGIGVGATEEAASSGKMMEVLSNPEAIWLILTSVSVVYLDILQGRYIGGETWQALEVRDIAAFSVRELLTEVRDTDRLHHRLT